MSDHFIEVITSLFFIFFVFGAVFLKWSLPINLEFLILIYTLLFFAWALYKKLPETLFYSISLIYLFLLLFVNFLKLDLISEYVAVFIFYFLTFGLVTELIRRKRGIIN